jgi:hypothetical protein
VDPAGDHPRAGRSGKTAPLTPPDRPGDRVSRRSAERLGPGNWHQRPLLRQAAGQALPVCGTGLARCGQLAGRRRRLSARTGLIGHIPGRTVIVANIQAHSEIRYRTGLVSQPASAGG